ncbi:hypothetical protein KLER11_gp46 [Pararheinheimera phage vB_PsoM_KLER1-1]|nr:hypothetical protein KLER11_gp46 [Pararheinheimera phage vB_PsoM_KLER1-1]
MSNQDNVFWTAIAVLAVLYVQLCLTPSPALQQPEPTIQPGYPACISDDLLTQFAGGNFAMQSELITQGNCIHSSLIQYEFEIIGQGSAGVVQAKIYLPDDESIILFLPEGATNAEGATNER